MFFYAIRGAITVEVNTPQDILDKTTVLLETIIEKNQIDYEDIVSIIFTGTKDLDSQYPAVAARQLGMVDIPLFCCQEMYVRGSLEKCIRILIHIQTHKTKNIKHIYLEGAKSLRPDLLHSELEREPKEKKSDRIMTIAIDGPAGAGKSTIARIVSKSLNIIYLDTGAMYRAVAYKMLNSKIDLKDNRAILDALDSTNIEIVYNEDVQRVILDGHDITPLIRTSEISIAASKVAVIPEVRKKLVEIQRRIAKTKPLVMDGRDIGSYVLPDASIKFYLTASLDERAKRRWKEMSIKGIEQDIQSIRRDIQERDAKDQSRSFAPLKQVKDAILIDTTDKSIEEVSEEILGHIDRYLYEK